MHFYVTQLYAGHWYVCEYTRESQADLHVPRDLADAYDTRQEAEAARAEANRRLQGK